MGARPGWVVASAAYRLTMMPNTAAGRVRRSRVAAAAVAIVVLVIATAQVLGPFAPGPISAALPTSGAAAQTGSPAPIGSPVVGAPAASGRVGASGSGGLAASPASPSPVSLATQLQDVLDRARAKDSIPGVSVAILWDDGRSWVGASGLRNVATADPMTPGTAFALASVSKTFTAAVVLELVQEGKLALDQSVAPLLPAFGLDRRITVRMLLDHTSGLPDFFLGKGVDEALLEDTGATWTASASWGYVAKKHAVPGTTWAYSNTNYLLLGQLVTAITGRSLAWEVRTRLLNPLGLSTAYYQAAETPREAGAVAYLLLPGSGGGWVAKPVAPASDVMPFRSVVTAAGGAGSIAATALDAARWMRAWAGGQVLSPGMQAQMLADIARTVRLHAAIPYGLGIQRVTLNGYSALGHSGRYLGMRDVVRYLPAAGVTIAVLTNQSLYDPSQIASALLNVVLPIPTPTATPNQVPTASATAHP